MMKFPANERALSQSMTRDLGASTMERFGPARRPLNLKESLLTGRPSQLEAYLFVKIRAEHDASLIKHGFDTDLIFRVTVYHKFNVDKALKLLKRMHASPYWNSNRSVTQLEAQLLTHTLFSLPCQLTSMDKKIQSFFYMKPSRFIPNSVETPTSALIANLLYVMDGLDRFSSHIATNDHPPGGKKKNSNNHKIGFIANMNDWTMENFAPDYCKQFMECLQGKRGPVQVDLFLIVNPPAWFGRVWNIMKPMLSLKFRAKVHMISESKLDRYLAPGYEQYLPQEFAGGTMDIESHVQDYIRYRSYIETKVYPTEPYTIKETGCLVQPQKRELRM